jgi:hypothetical protein
MTRKIAMLGTHPSGAKAPLEDLSWEIWGVAARGNYVHRADRWFEIHRLEGYEPSWGAAWRDEIRTTLKGVPIWMIWPEPDLGDVRQYPVQRMIDRFGTFFMTSSFSWMMALAIDELAPKGTFAEPGSTIGIWGMEAEYGTEYRHQRSGIRHFMRLADVLGIEIVRMADGGLIMEPIPYPMLTDDPLLAKIEQRKTEVVKQISQHERDLQNIDAQVNRNFGCADEINRMNEPGYRQDLRAIELELAMTSLSAQANTLHEQKRRALGALEEERFFLDYLRP